MIRVQYSALFSIGFLHDFYTNKNCGNIAIIPTRHCSNQFKKSGLWFVITATGCKVFAKLLEQVGKAMLQTALIENIRVEFQRKSLVDAN